MSFPLVAIVGAPNVGKSTLFNRLVGRRHAIVTDEPGVTRDRLVREVRGEGRATFRLVDTGGLTPRTEAPFAREIEQQAERALDEAALVLFVVDARAGATALDRDIADMLRRRGCAPLLIANKIDGPGVEPLVHDLYDLGVGAALAISAEHGLGIDELLDAIEERLAASGAGAAEEEERPDAREIRVAIVGRPNVGKSSILNRLVGEERMLVSDVAGTTRDAVDTRLELEGRRFLLVDTAGLRRRGKARHAAEVFSIDRARKSIQRADVAILVLDGAAGFAAQDAHIAGYVQDAWKPLVVAVNKWDLLEEREQAAKDWQERVRYHLRFAKQAPVALVSAKSGQRVTKLLDLVEAAWEAAGRTVPTPTLNRWLERVSTAERGAPAAGRSIRLLYATQTGIRPPSFVLFCSDPRRVHFSLRRFLENSLRREFDFGPSPIRLQFRGRRER
jgi:GTP-binding protein